MREAVRRTIERHALLRAGERVGVAASGGADSTALLVVLGDLAEELEIALRVVHVNHGLRGAESDADQAFVEAQARERGWEFRVFRADLAGRGGNLEQEARRARYRWFAELIEEGWVDKIATGHHKDDQAETVLFRLMRGAAGPGLAGIRPSLGGKIVRPLLDADRGEIRRELRRRGLAWREDSSNRDLTFSRNRLRRETLPRLAAEWNPKLADALARTAEAAGVEEDYWREVLDPLAERLLVERDGWIEASVAEMRELHRAVRRRLLRRVLQTARGDLAGLDSGHMERVEELIERASGNGAAELPGATVERSCGRLRIVAGRPAAARPSPPVQVAPPAEAASPDGRTRIRLADSPGRTEIEGYTNRYGFVLDADRLPRTLTLRTRREGDRFGSGGKLKELFQRFGVPQWERDGWPVLAAGRDSADEQRVVWSRGFGVAPEFQAGPGTRRRMEIREVDLTGREIRRIADWGAGVYRT